MVRASVKPLIKRMYGNWCIQRFDRSLSREDEALFAIWLRRIGSVYR